MKGNNDKGTVTVSQVPPLV